MKRRSIMATTRWHRKIKFGEERKLTMALLQPSWIRAGHFRIFVLKQATMTLVLVQLGGRHDYIVLQAPQVKSKLLL